MMLALALANGDRVFAAMLRVYNFYILFCDLYV